MVEEIITALSRFKWLFVIARNSSFTFKGKAVDIKEVGRRLGVRYVLEGSVRKAAGKVRITGQLIDAVTGAHIWADRFERDLTDIFSLQDEVTLAVISAIQPKMLQTEMGLAARRRPKNPTAYDLYLWAIHQYSLMNREGLAEAIWLAHRGLELEPRSGTLAAWAGFCHMFNITLGYTADPRADADEAIRLLRLALSLDENDPETLAPAGSMTAFFLKDYEGAMDLADRAVGLNPNSAHVWTHRGWICHGAGQPDDAIRSFERAIRMSPLDPFLYMVLLGMGLVLIEARRFDEAVEAAKKALRQHPFLAANYRCLASALAHLGRDVEAREAAARLLEIEPGFRISAWAARSGQSRSKLQIEGLRKAGLPE
jgi:adenylate cyclase